MKTQEKKTVGLITDLEGIEKELPNKPKCFGKYDNYYYNSVTCCLCQFLDQCLVESKEKEIK